MMTPIEQAVFDKYPVTKDERCCALKKQKMEFLRQALRKRLMDEWQGKNQILTSIQPGEPEV
jgi:hypothetical protein